MKNYTSNSLLTLCHFFWECKPGFQSPPMHCPQNFHCFKNIISCNLLEIDSMLSAPIFKYMLIITIFVKLLLVLDSLFSNINEKCSFNTLTLLDITLQLIHCRATSCCLFQCQNADKIWVSFLYSWLCVNLLFPSLQVVKVSSARFFLC